MAQVEKIFEVTGNPTARDVQSWQSPFAVSMVQNVQAKDRVRLNDLCHDLPRDAKHLMKRLFQLDPRRRGTADSALGHEYLADFHDPAKESVYPHGPVKIGIDDGTKLSAGEYRQTLYDAIHEKKEASRRSRDLDRTMNTGAMGTVPSAVSYDDGVDRSSAVRGYHESDRKG